jgi:hypothetical protein
MLDLQQTGWLNWRWEEIVGGESTLLDRKVMTKNFQVDEEDLVRECYEWQINNLKYKSWAKKN